MLVVGVVVVLAQQQSTPVFRTTRAVVAAWHPGDSFENYWSALNGAAKGACLRQDTEKSCRRARDQGCHGLSPLE